MGQRAARSAASNLLYWMSGSVSSVSHPYWIENANDVKNGTWQDVLTVGGNRRRNQVSTEWAFFAKDDYKVNRRLTLNLGLRWEYYGSPYLRSGFTSAALGLGDGLWGAGQGAGKHFFDSFLTPGGLYLTGYGSSASNPLACVNDVRQSPLLPLSTCDPSKLTQIEFVGPSTPNPGKTVIPNDWNNFGPAVGFAWQVPWFGEGKTTVRGGVQITYGQAGRNGLNIDTLLGSAPGNSITATTTHTDADIQAVLATRALNLTDIAKLAPVRPNTRPGDVVPIYRRAIAFQAYDPNYATPYTENFTLSVTRSLPRNVTVDVRYVGTFAKKQAGNLNLNDVSVYHNPELLEALRITRAGGDAPLFDQMLAGLNLNTLVAGYGPVGTTVNGVLQTGSAHLRRSTTFQTALANGDLEAVANSLVTLNPGTAGGLQALPIDPATRVTLTGVSQRVLRNGCDRLANGLYDPSLPPSSTNIPTRCFPEDYFVSNPQFTTATYNANLGHSTYHSLQVQFTTRQIYGMNFQATYSWAKSMQLQSSGYTDPLNRRLDYTRGREGPHSFRTNGTFELPIGPNKFLLGNSTGWLARIVEGWRTSIILNLATGSPVDVTGAGNTLYGNARYDVVSPSWKIPKGEVQWNGNNNAAGNLHGGTFYGNPSPYISVRDPQCSGPLVGSSDRQAGAQNLQASCTLNALGLVVPAGTAGASMASDG